MKWPWRRYRGPDAARLEQAEAELAAAETAERQARESLAATRRLAREREAILRTEANFARMRAQDPFAASVAQQILDSVRERRHDV